MHPRNELLVCTEYNFCFLHIPKCGGSSIKDLISNFDTLKGKFEGTTNRIPGGIQQKAHLPVSAIREYYPDIFSMIKNIDKIVIVREPEARFVSAMSQRAREVHKKFLDELQEAELVADFRKIVGHLQANPELPSYEYRHFIRQTYFTHLDGELFVQHIFPLENMHELLEFLSSRVGKKLNPNFRSNQTVAVRHKILKRALVSSKNLTKTLLPVPLYGHVRDFAFKLFANRGVNQNVLELLKKEGISEFVSEFYEEDYDLVSLAKSRPSRVCGIEHTVTLGVK